MCGILDLLVRVEKQPLFGKYSYIPYEVKSATTIMSWYVWQGAACHVMAVKEKREFVTNYS